MCLCDGNYGMLVLICCDGCVIGVLMFEGKYLLDYLCLLVEGFVCIYVNYIVLFDESECDKFIGLYNW